MDLAEVEAAFYRWQWGAPSPGDAANLANFVSLVLRRIHEGSLDWGQEEGEDE